ncbi:MAG: phosphatidate cytidylyltransferase [Pirellulales bacterium]|nr:phosphatidate cytidylyltransferase [Pirellulales bacterium]
MLISITAILLYLDATISPTGAEGIWLLPLLLFFSLGTAWDISGLLSNSGRPIRRRATLVATAIITLSACLPMMWPLFGSEYPPNCPVGKLGWITIASMVSVFLLLLAEMMEYGKGPAGAIQRICGGVFVSVYVGLPMALLVSLRSLGEGNWGLAALLTMIAVTKSTDAGAYFSGKTFGKHKLIPRLSPGKTREGAAGGILTATIVAFVCLEWLFPAIAPGSSGPVEVATIPGLDRPLWGALCLGPVLAITGMIGDLAESLVKRDSNAKDSGNLLPGLGGVWDVTDSLIAAVMPAFVCFVAGIAA